MNPFMLWNRVKGSLARKDLCSGLSDLTIKEIKLTLKIQNQMMIAKCLLKSSVKNLKGLCALCRKGRPVMELSLVREKGKKERAGGDPPPLQNYVYLYW
jgi:hypothetical protein